MIAFYLRLSIADGDIDKNNKEESNSIENQRLLLQTYMDAQNELKGEICEYVDDGYSGMNFDRPEFQRMLSDIKKGKVHIILLKDLSRLGRNYIEVGDYLEQIFPVLGVRVIAVNSRYDSNDYIGQSVGFDITISNLVNHFYSRDISKKVKSGLRTKWSRGISTTGRLPYGYIKDPSAKGGWRIDPEAGRVVRDIFEKALEGWSTKMIVEWLNKEGYAPPGKYYAMKKGIEKQGKVPEKESLWDTEKLYVILRRYEYTGAFVNNKHQSIQPGSKRFVKNSPSEYYITENAHDAIITKEEYENAQLIIKKIKKNSFCVAKKYALKGKVRCGNCKLAMSYCDESNSFYCPHKASAGSSSKCYGSYYDNKVIESVVFYELNNKIILLHEIKENIAVLKKQNCWRNIEDKVKREKRIIKLKSERILLYESYAEGTISKEKYLQKRNWISSEISSLELEKQKIENILLRETKIEEAVHNLSEQSNLMSYDKLTKEIADIYIETVYLYDPKHLEIVFTFDDFIKETLEYLNTKAMIEVQKEA